MLKSTLAISLLFAITIITGCGAHTQQIPVLTSAQVFSNKAEVWTFQNAYGDLTFVEIMPQPDGSTVWHYTKTADRAYWMVGGRQAELYFFLEKDGQGNWYSTGGHIIAPFGAPWDATLMDLTYSVAGDPGMPRPYLIIHADTTAPGLETTFPDPDPGTRWGTHTGIEYVETPIYRGLALISDQFEGICVHEKWYFAPDLGLVKVDTPNDGGIENNPACLAYGGPLAHDPNLWLERIK